MLPALMTIYATLIAMDKNIVTLIAIDKKKSQSDLFVNKWWIALISLLHSRFSFNSVV